MARRTEKKVLIPLRLCISDKARLDKKVIEDKLSMQKVIEVLVKEYLKDNKQVMEIIKKYVDMKYARKDVAEFTDWEEEALINKIAAFSPFKT